MDIKKSISNIIENIIAQYLLWLVGLAVLILTWLRQLPLYQILLIALGMFGFIFWGMNQYTAWKVGRKKNFAIQTDAEIANTVRKWFDKRHYSSSTKTDATTWFRIVGIDPQNRKLNVFKPKENPSVICIRLGINEEQLSQILPQPHQNMARFNIGIEMARIGLSCQSKSPMHIDRELQCDEFLTESSFWTAIDKIRQGHVLIEAHLKVALIAANIEKQNPSTTEPTPDKGGSQKQ